MNNTRAEDIIAVFSDIIPADVQGGSGTVVWELCRVLRDKGYGIVIFTKGIKGRPGKEVAEGITIYRYFYNPFKIKSQLAEICSGKKPDFIFLHQPFTAFWVIRSLSGIPALYFFQSPWHEEYEIRTKDLGKGSVAKTFGSLARRIVEKYVLKKSRVIFTASEFMSDRLKAIHSLNGVVIPLGVDTGRFHPTDNIPKLRRELNLPEDRTILLTVRNLVSRMGLDNLILAMKEITGPSRDIFLVIGGEGYLREKLEQMVRDNNLTEYVRFVGHIPEKLLPAYYQAADIFILPTRLLEGFGLVTLEAMSCGTPVLATPIGANPEVLGKFNPEHLFKGTAPENIAEGIMKFLPRYNKSGKEIRETCRKYVLENYSWKKYADEIESVCHSCLPE